MLRTRDCWIGAVVLCLVTAGALAAGGAVNVAVLEDTPQHIVVHYDLGDFTMNAVDIDGQKYTQIVLGKESPFMQAGAPELPNICRSVIIPDDAAMAVRVLDSTFYEINDIDVAPSKGILMRTVNPADVPYTFGEVYNTDAFWPGAVATLREPYIMRDYRGTVIDVNPFQYNPVARTLRVYTAVTAEVVSEGPGQINVLSRQGRADRPSYAFDRLYTHHFLNYGTHTRYAPLDEEGDMLIICHDAWIPRRSSASRRSGITPRRSWRTSRVCMTRATWPLCCSSATRTRSIRPTLPAVRPTPVTHCSPAAITTRTSWSGGSRRRRLPRWTRRSCGPSSMN